MGTDKAAGRPQNARPVKAAGARRRREKVQRERLMELGVAESKITHMTTKAVRQLLRRPARVAAAVKKGC
jgi:hypothetical protein